MKPANTPTPNAFETGALAGGTGLRTLPRRFFHRFRKPGPPRATFPKTDGASASRQIAQMMSADQLWQVTFESRRGDRFCCQVLLGGGAPRATIETDIRTALLTQHDIEGVKILSIALVLERPTRRLDPLTHAIKTYNAAQRRPARAG